MAMGIKWGGGTRPATLQTCRDSGLEYQPDAKTDLPRVDDPVEIVPLAGRGVIRVSGVIDPVVAYPCPPTRDGIGVEHIEDIDHQAQPVLRREGEGLLQPEAEILL